MTYREITGDLFDAGLPAIGHGCNVVGSMSGGIALQFKERFPQMHDEYVRRCTAGEFELDGFFVWETDDVVVYNLATQPLPGSNARFSAVIVSVSAALADAAERGLDALGIPRIGCGIGGLRWSDVSRLLRDVALQVPGTDLVIVTRAEDLG